MYVLPCLPKNDAVAMLTPQLSVQSTGCWRIHSSITKLSTSADKYQQMPNLLASVSTAGNSDHSSANEGTQDESTCSVPLWQS